VGKEDRLGKSTVESKKDENDSVGKSTVESKKDDSTTNNKGLQNDGTSSSDTDTASGESSGNNELIEKLVKTGKFTNDEAKEIADKHPNAHSKQ
jgi:hypothetical protein